MKNLRTVLLGAAAALALAACNTTVPNAAQRVDAQGNGAPSGAHYTLNIIGVEKGKTADLSNSNGRRIFVNLYESGRRNTFGETKSDTQILLKADSNTPGEFAVLDANGTDDGVASFQLPATVTNDYVVYVRALGKPGGSADMQTCYTDATGEWCLADMDGGNGIVDLDRTKGKSEFIDASYQLLNVTVCTAWDGTVCTAVEVVPLFSSTDYAEYWSYDNNGLRLAQLRFYAKP